MKFKKGDLLIFKDYINHNYSDKVYLLIIDINPLGEHYPMYRVASLKKKTALNFDQSWIESYCEKIS